jgi:hypothetical protein
MNNPLYFCPDIFFLFIKNLKINRMKNHQTKKQIWTTVAMMLAAVSAFAQGNGSAGISEATTMVTSYFDPATKLIYAIGAVVGLIGGVKVYTKFV